LRPAIDPAAVFPPSCFFELSEEIEALLKYWDRVERK